MFRLFSILDDALDSIAWMIVFAFASNGYSRRGTDEHSVSGNESGPRVGQISGNGLSSIPENQRIYGIDPNRIHDWHLIMYVTGLVSFYLASARLAVLPQGGLPKTGGEVFSNLKSVRSVPWQLVFIVFQLTR